MNNTERKERFEALQEVINRRSIECIDKGRDFNTLEGQKLISSAIDMINHIYGKNNLDNLVLWKTLQSCIKAYSVDKGNFSNYFLVSYKKSYKTASGIEIGEIIHGGVKISEKERKAISNWYREWKDVIVGDIYNEVVDEIRNETFLDRDSNSKMMDKEIKALKRRLADSKPSLEEREEFSRTSGIDIDTINQWFMGNVSLDAQLGSDTEGYTLMDSIKDNNSENMLRRQEDYEEKWDVIEETFNNLQDRQKAKMKKIITSTIVTAFVDENMEYIEDEYAGKLQKIKDRSFFDNDIWERYINGETIEQQMIAEMLGVLPQDVSRSFNRFKEKVKKIMNC